MIERTKKEYKEFKDLLETEMRPNETVVKNLQEKNCGELTIEQLLSHTKLKMKFKVGYGMFKHWLWKLFHLKRCELKGCGHWNENKASKCLRYNDKRTCDLYHAIRIRHE